MNKVLITSALPYANGPLHFGHIAGAYLPGDCYARFQRMQGNDVLYICGTDEFGIAITLNAEMAGRSPQEHVDLFHGVIKDLFQKLNFSFDHFSRTTWSGHVEPTHQYFNSLLAKGYIEERVTDQLYSEADDRFLADRYVVGTCPQCGFENARGDECPKCGAAYEATDLKNPRSKLTNSALTRRPTKHWFLLLDKFKDRLTDWLNSKDWKPNVVNFIKHYIDDLRPRAITRDMSWGIPVPLKGAEGKVLYVWFDAPIGYISATKEWAEQRGEPELWKQYWCDKNTKLVQFVGKDNIPFHAAIFPAMTMGRNEGLPEDEQYVLVNELPANEFYNLEGRQFSKSDGWYIDLADFFSRYTADQIRYAIAANAPETADSEFTWKDFQIRCNSELLGKFGNFINRTLVFLQKSCEGKVPSQEQLEPVDQEFLATTKTLAAEIKEAYETFKLRRASQLIMELAQAGNVYFDSKQPWKDAKNADLHGRMNTTIACCIECCKLLALVSYPIMPVAAMQIWQMLGFENEVQAAQWDQAIAQPIEAGRALPSPHILFTRVEDEQVQAEIDKLTKLKSSNGVIPQVNANATPKPPVEIPSLKPLVDITDVQKLDLRVGVIENAVPVPKSKKLLQLQVDLGFEKRTIVAGISLHYSPEALVGKRVVVVANLKPATLMGVESRGMVLAGSDGSTLQVVSIEGLPPGSVVS